MLRQHTDDQRRTGLSLHRIGHARQRPVKVPGPRPPARLVTLVLLSVIALLAAEVSAQADEIDAGSVRVVHPTGEHPTDYENVQSAIDLGGTVLLKATDAAGLPTAFDFGPAVSQLGGRVFLTTDVAVIGETAGSATTTILGGSVPFFGNVAVTSRIEGITFEAPLLSAIIITRSTGSDIVGNRITSVVGSELPSVSGVTDFTEGRGIKFLGNSDPDAAIAGIVRVVGNVIQDMHADLSDAIVFDAVAADVEVSGNRIETTQSSGIYVIGQGGSMHITDNVVVPGPGDPGEFSFGNGITVAGSRGSSFDIARNEIVCENPAADGVYIVGGGAFGEVEGATVTRNSVTMLGSAFAAIALEDGVSRTLITKNKIVGGANHAFDLRQVHGASTAVSNEIRANDLVEFDASAGEVFLDRHTRSTRVKGARGIASDMGQDNVLSGFAPIPLGPAQDPFTATVIVPAPGPGVRLEPITAAASEFDVEGVENGFDNARIEIRATPTIAGDVDLYAQRQQLDGSWLTVGSGAAFDVEGEHLALRRQPAGRYRVLVHVFAGGPQAVDLVVTFFNQDDVAGAASS